MKPRGICRWIGHKIDPETSDRMGIDRCLRCGDSSYYGEIEYPQQQRAWWWLRSTFPDAIRWKWRRLREWWRCPCCGGRFGRHDEKRCIPF